VSAPSQRSGLRQSEPQAHHVDRKFLTGLARAFAGAIIFALPMLMTMEMWWIGFYIDPWRLALLLIIQVPLLTALSHLSGFKDTEGWLDDVLDAFVAIAVAAIAATVILFVFSVIDLATALGEAIGKVAIQTFPASIGAMLARKQLAGSQHDGQPPAGDDPTTYGGEMFLMAVGALFLGLNMAPTEEMILLSYMMTPWREIGLVSLSLAAMHGFVYAVEFRGRPRPLPETSFWSLFLRFTVAGYALVLVICLYLLWTFGRTDGAGIQEMVSAVVVLGFPCAIGAAAARLIL
jgi:putative integral membrane protein (TIGR02587 family)